MQIKDTLGLRNKALEGRDQPQGVNRVEGGATESGAKANAASSDKVELSGRSRDMARASETAANTPAVRQQKVDEIKRQIESNQYQVRTDEVATKMIMEALGEYV